MTHYLKAILTGAAALAAIGASTGTASAQSTYRRTANDARTIVKWTERRHIEASTHAATGNRYRVSSRDRVGSLASSAHNRGASDFARRDVWGRSDMHRDAAAIARRIGPGHSAIVEQPRTSMAGRQYDLNTSYRAQAPFRDVRVNGPYRVPGRATGDHIHVQPDGYGRRTAPTYRSYQTSRYGNYGVPSYRIPPPSNYRYYGSSSYRSTYRPSYRSYGSYSSGSSRGSR